MSFLQFLLMLLLRSHDYFFVTRFIVINVLKFRNVLYSNVYSEFFLVACLEIA